MTKEPKKMTYAVGPIVRLAQDKMSSDGGTQKKANALEGKWIKLNEAVFAFEESDKVTIIHIDEESVGCACGRCDDGVLCEHLLAFGDLKSPPQLTIESEDYRWLRTYLMGLKWYPENRWLYSPENTKPEVVAELPPVDEAKEELDPVNEDKPLDTGVDEEPEPKTYSRKCVHCGDSISGTDLTQVKLDIVEHTRGCPKNPPNKKTAPRLVTQDALKQPTDAKDTTVEEPQSKKFTCEICGTEHTSADDVLNCIERCKESQELSATKALVTQDHISEGETWTDAQLEVMRKTVAANATPEEFAYFLNVAKYSGLNPFLREIYFVKNEKGQTTIITGRDGYLTIAKSDPRFRGIHSMEVCENDEFEMSFENGIMSVSKHKITNIVDRGKILGAWACGRMAGQDPVTIFASMSEYDKSGNAKGGKIWKQYTSSMIRKVVESMVLKRIAGISGLVTEAEIGG